MRKMLAETSCGLSNTRNSQHHPVISSAEARRLRRLLHSENELRNAVQPGLLMRRFATQRG